MWLRGVRTTKEQMDRRPDDSGVTGRRSDRSVCEVETSDECLQRESV